MSATKANPIFTPYKLKADKPDLFKKAVQSQKDIQNETYVIKMEGLTSRMIPYIKQATTHIQGIQEFVPTYNHEVTGEYKALVHRSNFSSTSKAIRNDWKTIVNSIPQELFDNIPYTFEYPKITSHAPSDDDQSAEDSYVSALTASLRSVRTSISDSTPATNKSVCWTDIVVNKTQNAPSTASSFTQAEFDSMSQRIKELEAELKELKKAQQPEDQPQMSTYWPLFCQFMKQMERQESGSAQNQPPLEAPDADSLPKKRPAADGRMGQMNGYLVPLTRSHKKKSSDRKATKISDLTEVCRDD